MKRLLSVLSAVLLLWMLNSIYVATLASERDLWHNPWAGHQVMQGVSEDCNRSDAVNFATYTGGTSGFQPLTTRMTESGGVTMVTENTYDTNSGGMVSYVYNLHGQTTSIIGPGFSRGCTTRTGGLSQRQERHGAVPGRDRVRNKREPSQCLRGTVTNITDGSTAPSGGNTEKGYQRLHLT